MSQGQRLRYIRKKLGLNQSQLAKMIDISERTLRYYEKDQILINSEIMYRITKEFNISLPWLMDGSGPMQLGTLNPSISVSGGVSVNRAELRRAVGVRIRQVRQVNSMSQAEFAKVLHTSMAYISKVESGKNMPGGEFFYSLKLAFNISIDWVLTGEGRAMAKSDNRPT